MAAKPASAVTYNEVGTTAASMSAAAEERTDPATSTALQAAYDAVHQHALKGALSRR